MVEVSVVIPNYNGEKYLIDCIRALMRQTYLRFETIIIDNASHDSEYSWLGQYKEIIFIKLEKNYGFSKAVNEGIKLSNGKYVLLLNNDTIIAENFIEELVKMLKNNSKIFGISSKMIAFKNHQIIDDAGDEYNLLGWAYKLGDGKSVDLYTKPYRIFSTCAGAALYRKSVFEKIGYFDENFFAYMEDVDISYRANIYGYKNVYCPEAKVLHIGSATSGSKYNSFKVKLAARNNIYVPYKNMPLLQLVINFPFLVLGVIIKYIFFVKKGFGKEYKEGFIEGLKTLKDVEKVPFNIKHLPNYVYIEWLLIKNTFKYLLIKLNLI